MWRVVQSVADAANARWNSVPRPWGRPRGRDL